MELSYRFFALAILYNLMGFVNSFPHLKGVNEVPINIEQSVPDQGRYRRSTDDGFPDQINVALPVDGTRVELVLRRNKAIRQDLPVLLNRVDRIVHHKIPDQMLRDTAVAFYYELKNGSSFMAWHNRGREDSEHGYLFFGIFSLGSREYQVQPADQFNVSHTVSLIPDDGPRVLDFVKPSGNDHHRFREYAGRRKRQTPTAYEIETFFVIDYAVYSFWYDQTNSSTPNRANVILNNINQFYAFILNTINVRYASVTGRGYTMTCIYSGIYVADSPAAAPFIEDNLLADDGSARRKADVDVVLPAFRNWSNTNLAAVHDYDHVFMFTAYDIGSIESGTFKSSIAGYAYVSGLCQDIRQSVNEDFFHANLGTVAAHELGHNLGSAHDGTGNTCTGDDGYVMAASSSQTFTDLDYNRRKFMFSSCSLDYFDAYIDTLGSNNCMEARSSTYNASALDAYANDFAGQTYSPDQQCGYIQGSGAYLYRAGYTNYEDICALMRCSVPENNGTHYARLAWEGTTCGNGKLCEAGSCVVHASAPTGMTETCLFGDTPYNLPNVGETCTEFLGAANASYRCYTESYRLHCCETCDIHKQNNINRTDCEYGDKASWCATLSRSDCYSNDAVCCQSCAEQASSDANCLYGDKESWCSTLSRTGCYSNDATCCEYCPSVASSNPGCLYGDRATGCDVNSCSLYDETTRTSTCCETCADPTTTSSTTVAMSTSSTATSLSTVITGSSLSSIASTYSAQMSTTTSSANPALTSSTSTTSTTTPITTTVTSSSSTLSSTPPASVSSTSPTASPTNSSTSPQQASSTSSSTSAPVASVAASSSTMHSETTTTTTTTAKPNKNRGAGHRDSLSVLCAILSIVRLTVLK